MEERDKGLEARVQALECMVITLIKALDAIHAEEKPGDGVLWMLDREVKSLRADRHGLRAFYLDGLIDNFKNYTGRT